MKRKRLVHVFMVFILAAIYAVSCSKDESSTGPDNSGGDNFTLGTSKTYQVSGSVSVNVQDSISGATFVVTPGGSETITVAPITEGPEIPFAGTRFHIEYTGNDPVTLRIPGNTQTEDVVLMFWGEIEGAAIDDMTGNTAWWGVPPSGEGDGYVEFKVALESAYVSKAAPPGTTDTNNFAITKLTSGSGDFNHLRVIYQTVNQVIDTWIGHLPAGEQADARAKVTALPWTVMWTSDGNHYKHVTNAIFSPKVILYFKQTADISSIAHETGHYLCHAMIGDTRYNELYNRFPTDFWGASVKHMIGSYREGRREMFEDYPYTTMYMIEGAIEQHDPTGVAKFNNARDLIAGGDPAEKDYPSHEGFAAVMLASLLRTGDTIYSFNTVSGGQQVKVPVVGASWGDVLTILGRGPRDPNELRMYMQDYLDNQGADHRYKLSAMLEPLGWSYNGIGFVKDIRGNPVKNAIVASICQDGTREYRAGLSTPTIDSGEFTLPRIYPGTNNLRIYWNDWKDSTDVAFTADWAKPTNQTLRMGTISIDTTPAPVTITMNRTFGPNRISYGSTQIADVTMNITFTATGSGLIESEYNNVIRAPINSQISAQVTTTFNVNILSTTSESGLTFEVDEPEFKTYAYDALRKVGDVDLNDERSENMIACTFTLRDTSAWVGMTTAFSFTFDVFDDGDLISSDLGEFWYGPAFGIWAIQSP